MDISKTGNNITHLSDYKPRNNKPEQNKEEKGAKEKQTVSSEKLALYANPKLAGNAQIVQKFGKYINKQLGNQLGSLKSYMQGYLDGSGRSPLSIDNLEALLSKRYGIESDLDAANVMEGGFYSAEATSDRLVEFAIGISGGDSSKAEMLIDAVKKGFELAQDTWGGELPDICQRTYELTMEKFEAWKAGEFGA